MTDQQPLWKPSAERIAASNLARFCRQLGKPVDMAALHAWSVAEPVAFWRKVWDFCGVIGDQGGPPYLVDADKMPGAKFFPNARINLAENLLRRRDDGDGVIFWGEDKVKRKVTWAELNNQVSRCAQGLKAAGVRRQRKAFASAGSSNCS